MNFTSRLKLAANIVSKGSLFPFNKVPPDTGGGSGAKLTNPYAKSVWVQRAIKKVSAPVAAVPLRFVKTGTETDISDPRLVEFWKKPAVGLGYHDFIEASIGWLKLKGECFWLLDDSAIVPFPEVKQKFAPMILARPDRMREVVNQVNFTGSLSHELLGWEYTDKNGRRHRLTPEQVVHLKFWNPNDDVRGLAEYEAAEIAAESDYLAGNFNRNLMRNNGDTGPIIAAKNGIPTDVQQTQIINQLRMKREMAQRGEFRPVFLTSDITVEDARVKTPDGDFVNVRLQNRHEIFIAFGVPPSMADKMESYSVGSASDWYMLLNETCMPTADKLCGGIDLVNERIFGISAESYCDFDEHPVLQTVRRERLEAADKLWAKGMPMESVNEYLRLGLKPFDGWNVGYLPFSVAPVGAAEMTALEDPSSSEAFAEEEAKPKEDSGKKIAEMKAALGPVGRMKAVLCRHGGESGKVGEWESGGKGLSAKELALWKEHMSKRRVLIKAYESRFNKKIFAARSEVLGKLSKVDKSFATRAVAADFIFDLAGFKKGLLVEMRKIAKGGLTDAGKQLFLEVGSDDAFSMPDARALKFLEQRDNKLSETADEIYASVKGTLEEGLKKGESISELSDRVRTTFNGISKERATRIAMSETAAVYGEGRQEAMEQAGVQYKKWLTSGNDNVRAAHAAANGQTVPVDEPFEIGGEKLMHPGDEAGSPGNVINCHCVSIAVAAEE